MNVHTFADSLIFGIPALWVAGGALACIALIAAAIIALRSRGVKKSNKHLTTSRERFLAKLDRIRDAVRDQTQDQFARTSAAHCKALKVALVLYVREQHHIIIKNRLGAEQREAMLANGAAGRESVEPLGAILDDLADTSWDTLDVSRFSDLLDRSYDLTQSKKRAPTTA
jgi:hypothetical protein